MKTVMAFGTFDIFHPGHKFYLSEARKRGDFLVVVVARDENVLKIKGKLPRNSEEKRVEVLREQRFDLKGEKNASEVEPRGGLADEVVLGDLVDRYAVIEKFRPDVIALGYDQKVNEVELRDKLQKLDLDAEIVRISAHFPEKYKSSKLG